MKNTARKVETLVEPLLKDSEFRYGRIFVVAHRQRPEKAAVTNPLEVWFERC